MLQNDLEELDQLDDAKYAVYEKAIENYNELRTKLAAAYALESGRIDASSTKNGFQRDFIHQFDA